MKKKNKVLGLPVTGGLLLLLTMFVSCDLPEHYFSEMPECTQGFVFKGVESPDMSIHTDVLLTYLKMKKPSDFRYRFKTFESKGDKVFMVTSFRKEGTCFDVKILVEHWDKLAGMRRTNGRSYPKELYDLKWEIINVNGEEVVYYIDMHRIID